MPTTTRLSGAELSFHAERIDVPIGRITARMEGDGPSFERPAIVAPQVSDELEIQPVRELALREILRHAHSGKARVHLKLPARKIPVGPLSLDLEGHEVVIELEVEGASIKRGETRGTIEPPLPLPLGMELRSLYLNKEGDVVADISGLPDLNLTALVPRVPRVPATLDEILALLFDSDQEEDDGDGGGDAEGNSGATPAFDMSGLYVEARDVVPRAETLDLGGVGDVLMGPETLLDVDVRGDEIRLRGRVHVLDARLHGTGFQLSGLSGKGSIEWELHGIETLRETTLSLVCDEARLGRADLRLRDGSHLHLGPSMLGRSTARLVREGRQTRFGVSLEDLRGTLESAVVNAMIGEQLTAVELEPTDVAGSATLSDRHVEVDLALENAEARASDVKLHLGLADLDLATARAKATGQLKAGTDFGLAFSGQLAVSSEVRGGFAHLGDLHARLDPGSEAVLFIQEIAASEDGLDALVADGELKLRFHSGRLPLGSGVAVEFSRGAEGGVTLQSVELRPGEPWPRVRGSGHVEAISDPMTFRELAEVPPGRASVDGRFRLDERGHLIVSDLQMTLRSVESE
jgi:hypothetical protein